MAHRALTLKYRPQVFSDLVGQEHVSVVLARALETGRVAHAYLFTGARGVGKTTSARILAKSLNCEKRASGEKKGADPCNECTSCVEITSGVSLDVAEIDGASNRGIADVQALREKVRFTPTGGRYRVVIIDEVHQLSNDAFAALLKTLEEPPRHLVFIFATTDPQKLPDTIRSRTQRFDFARVPLRKVADRLLDIAKRETKDKDGIKFKLTEGAALLIAQKSEGALRDAVSALDQVISSGETEVDEEHVRRILGLADREVFFSLADAIVGHDPKAALHALHQAFNKGLEAREIAEGLSEHVRHVLILKVDPEGGADLVVASGEDLARLRAQGGGWSEQDLLRLLKIASEVLVPMKDSPQPLVHLEAAIVQMATLEPGEALADLLARLERLEKSLGGSPTPSGRPTPAPSAARGGGGGRGSSWSASAATSAASAPTTPRASLGSGYRPSAPTATQASVVAPVARASAAIEPTTSVAIATAGPAVVEPAIVTRDERTERLWSDTIARVNARKRMLGAFLEECHLVGLAGGALVLAMDDLHRAVIEEKENRAIIVAEMAQTFGAALELECGAIGAGDATPAAPARKPDEVKDMIDRTLAWFHGESVTPAQKRPERTNG
jgi:DNA polymerase-3 subunit gamma/tau